MSWLNHENALPGDEGKEVTARVKWFNVSKGFGFVTPADGSADAFLHISVLNRAGLPSLGEDTEILCRIAPGARGTQVTHLIEVKGPVPAGRPGTTGPIFEVTGTVKWFKPDKGYGFVLADDADKDVFVHKNMLQRCGFTGLDAGQRVRMKVHEASKGREATWIDLL